MNLDQAIWLTLLLATFRSDSIFTEMNTKPELAGYAAFEEWWRNEGSGIPPLPGEDAETHVRRVSRIAWLVGMQKAIESLNKRSK